MAVDAFLTFTGSASNITISGESTDTNHPNAIELKAFDFGIQNSITIGSASGGAGAGKATFSPFKFMKTVDKSSPLFLRLIGLGAHFSSVVLTLRKASGGAGTSADYVIYTFGTVFVTSQETSFSAGDEAPTETIQLVFGSLGVQYKVQSATGQFTGSTTSGSWDQIYNK